ncbi:MAG: S9 family peptidase [Gammaproteobacteria bacterium HGW-Gammaproteobacteria-4]|nr:MAG: S9 family peptidase [Gammaproteobacteria bacterium HGW-Gammaproteobacteria-4]
MAVGGASMRRSAWRDEGEVFVLARMLFIAVIATLAGPVADAGESPKALDSAGALFGMRESVQSIDISPDGTRVAYITPGPGRTSVAVVADLVNGGPLLTALRASGNPDRLSWCKFVTNQRLICRVVGQVKGPDVLVAYARLAAVDIDGKNFATLGEEGSSYDARLRQFDGDIIDWLPDDDGVVLMAREYIPEEGKKGTLLVRKKDGVGIDRVNVVTLKNTMVESPTRTVDYFLSDGRGKIRIKSWQPKRGGSGQLDSREVYHYRLPDSKEWLPFSSWDGTDGMIPIAIDAEINSAYVKKKLDGRMALYRVKLDGTMATELVYKSDTVDIDGVVRIGRGARVIGVTFAEEKRSVIYFDSSYRQLATVLGKAIPNLPIIGFLGSSADNGKLLVYAGSDSDPGRYFVFDKSARTLNEILLARPALENVALASVRPVTYPASDGTMVPGYLTLPPNRSDARNLPAVVLPHGGPSARDEWGFDWLSQFLAHEGYAVLQPNYRGSAGFGDAWLQENGFKSWRTSIGDVTAAAHWMSTEGIADPDRIAIVGWSYGGYAALQSGVLEPGLFKALVAVAPVTDLELLKKDAHGYTNARIVAEELGSGAHIVEGSPLQNFNQIAAPVLMFHGDLDLNVSVEQSRKMDAKLRAAGKACELVVYEGLEHSLVDSDVRAQMLDRIAAFLRANVSATASVSN